MSRCSPYFTMGVPTKSWPIMWKHPRIDHPYHPMIQSIIQGPFQVPKLEVPIPYIRPIYCKAYVREYPNKTEFYMVRYLHFRILKSPLNNQWVYSWCLFLVGGWKTPSEKYESQLGWWHSQSMEKTCSKPPTRYMSSKNISYTQIGWTICWCLLWLRGHPRGD